MAFHKDNKFEKREILQAVVIADEFSNAFQPLTLGTSRLMLSFLNIPLIEYVLESLLASNIEETYIFCACNGNQVKDYLDKTRWMRKIFRKMEVHVIMSENCLTLGDALREIENKGVIKNDFVLLTGDIIFNFCLKEIIEEHKKRRHVIKDAVMTLIFKEYSKDHALRVEGSNITVTLEHSSKRLLTYHKDTQHHDHLSIPLDEIPEGVMKIRTDLLYREMCVCAPVVLSLMCDNPDYQSIDHLLRGILVNEKILGNTIFTHIIDKSAYAQRVSDLDLYRIVSRHVMDRWSYPLVLDEGITQQEEDVYRYKRGGLYTHHQLPTLKQLVSNVVVGKGSSVGDFSKVVNSVIGKQCRIGCNVMLENCYLFDSVVIEDDCKLKDSILGVGAHIHKKTNVARGCILSSGVHLHCTDTLQEFSKLVSKQLGKLVQVSETNTHCFVYEDEKSVVVKGEQEEEDDEWEEGTDELDGWEEDSEEEEEMDDAGRFYKEVLKNLQRFLKDDIAVANVLLEINSMKHAYGIEILNLVCLLIKALLHMPSQVPLNPPASFYPTFETHMKKFLPILKNYVKASEAQNNFQTELQVEVLSSMEEVAEVEGEVLKYLGKIVHYLYEVDVLCEESILVWWSGNDTEHNLEVVAKMSTFINWLEEEEEEED